MLKAIDIGICLSRLEMIGRMIKIGRWKNDDKNWAFNDGCIKSVLKDV